MATSTTIRHENVRKKEYSIMNTPRMFVNGRDNETRTHDLLLPKQARYLLRNIPKSVADNGRDSV